jgi:Flp pilus assembly protein TadD
MHQELATAVQLGGRSAELFDDLGAALDSQGNYADAVKLYSAGLELADQGSTLHARLLLKRGWANTNRPDLAAARQDFQQAVAAFPRNAEAYTGMGYVQALSGEHRAAEHSAVDALALSGSDDRVEHYLTLQNVACIYATLATAEKAEEQHYLDLTMALLKREVASWKAQGRPAPSALDVIWGELMRPNSAFPPSLRARADFQALFQGSADAP